MTQDKMSRRKFLGLAGGSIVVLVVGGVAYRAVDQDVFSTGRGSAYAPWINWQDAETAPERIVAAGILASNPHNSQPWLFRMGRYARAGLSATQPNVRTGGPRDPIGQAPRVRLCRARAGRRRRLAGHHAVPPRLSYAICTAEPAPLARTGGHLSQPAAL